MSSSLLRVSALLVSLISWSSPALAQTTGWSDVYDTGLLRSLNVMLTQEAYQTIRNDETFAVEVPATFWADDESEEYTISIRRKSATAIGDKISYRLKFTAQVGDLSVKTWHDLKTLSLENGDDQDVVREGFAWYLHRRAADATYQPGLAAWTTVTLHVVTPLLDESGLPILDEYGQPANQIAVLPQGVYVNVEMPDKQFLRHRGRWFSGNTWLYKQDDIGLPELKDWPDAGGTVAEFPSPAYTALKYSPFQATIKSGKKVINPTPNDTMLAQDLSRWINMSSMLRVGAANAFAGNPDELFNHGKNFYWADYNGTTDDRRVYFPWDLDASIRGTTDGIYATLSGSGKKVTASQNAYQSVILNHPDFRTQYNSAMTALLDGSYSVADLRAFLSTSEALLTPALLADPNNKIGTTPAAIAAHFDNLRAWVEARHVNVRSQVAKNGPPSPRAP